ncbi:hypothetical protein VOLCADRAFT_105559 [Volvox carteri f. nagariensis]|uniref:Uncharacterized protein n=1 Tax=Volvox carteri f. nagariensis TaxID=3068 RepID=D8U1K7_VOLCA|nr:uncharacterized protein VOLCADRAFT_105559 [Volvox carteri f. nagariensis]EFJ46357.1 hypothetical protein VOLCADRAFT_105559 [Volvox carteri f. nagariensis]|eukprot:XP_002952510.1 hypothetical protein VOLCADRAFT_105559 [Volvox carteri f. nagariensis]
MIVSRVRSVISTPGASRAGSRASTAASFPAPRHGVARRFARLVPRADVEGVMDEASKAKIEALMTRFKMADVDGNGYIDREELRNLLESMESGEVYLLSQHWLPEEELDAVMQTYDTNKDGVISFEEFKQIAYDGILLEGALSEYESAFKAVDKSGNGTIGATELGQLFAKLGNPVSPEKLVDLMQEYDKDDSGQIEFNEFLLMFRNSLLDLKAMSAYMTNNDAPGSGSVIEAVEGDMTLIFSEQELDEIIAANPNKLVVVFAALTWCRPCKGMQRPVQRLAEHYKNHIVFVKLFGNANKQTKNIFKDRYQIRSTPCFITLKDGQPVYTQTGTNKEKLEAGLRSMLTNPPVGMIYPSADVHTNVPALTASEFETFTCSYLQEPGRERAGGGRERGGRIMLNRAGATESLMERACPVVCDEAGETAFGSERNHLI